MNKEEKYKIIENEVKDIYNKYFDKLKNMPAPENESESNKISLEHYKRVQEYIKKRKKELGIDK